MGDTGCGALTGFSSLSLWVCLPLWVSLSPSLSLCPFPRSLSSLFGSLTPSGLLLPSRCVSVPLLSGSLSPTSGSVSLSLGLCSVWASVSGLESQPAGALLRGPSSASRLHACPPRSPALSSAPLGAQGSSSVRELQASLKELPLICRDGPRMGLLPYGGERDRAFPGERCLRDHGGHGPVPGAKSWRRYLWAVSIVLRAAKYCNHGNSG